MYLLTKYNTVLISLASLTSIFSFLTLLFASVESRKKNIYKTAPFITISFDDKEEKLYVKKLNNNIAKNIKIEPLLFYNQNKADDFLNPFKSKRLIFKPKTLQTYLINTTEELELSINNQGYDETTWNAIYYSFLKKIS